MFAIPATPLTIALLWCLAVTAQIVWNIAAAANASDYVAVSNALHLSGGVVLGGLLAVAILGRYELTGTLLASLLTLEAGRVCISAIAALVLGAFPPWAEIVAGGAAGGAMLRALAIIGFSGPDTKEWRRRVGACAGFAGCVLAAHALPTLENRFYEVSTALSGKASTDDYVPIDAESMWQRQPELIAGALAKIGSSRTTDARTVVIAIGAMGSQTLFGREARFAADVIGRRYGEPHPIVLANDADRIADTPLATVRNISALLTGLSSRIDSRRDTVLIYLTSHGSEDAELSTDVPGYALTDAISAVTLREALDRAGIKRRVIIVSACYSGTWIPILATRDSLIITAAAADRVSFGCDDRRQLTYFGEALLKGSIAKGESLNDAFLVMQSRVRAMESTMPLAPPSSPQMFVGAGLADYAMQGAATTIAAKPKPPSRSPD